MFQNNIAALVKSKAYVNLGCGGRYHPEWLNLDIVPRGPGVVRADLSKGIPLPGASCEVVYHSAVLEHIRREQVPSFIAECYRVLKPAGIIRIAVPDLERICRLYLHKLEQAATGNEEAVRDYDWLMLEAFDQMVRERSGGGMLGYLQQHPLPNEAFVLSRIGEEGRELLAKIRGVRTAPKAPVTAFRIMAKAERLIGSFRRVLAGVFLTAQERQALRIGRFRLSGEVHQWMYDRYSLTRVLRTAGFIEPQVFTATTSRIGDWTRYSLDALPDGGAVKPDLFYMEAIKPGQS